MSYNPEIKRYIAEAHELRAKYLADLVRQAWHGIKRLARRITLRRAPYTTPSGGPGKCSA